MAHFFDSYINQQKRLRRFRWLSFKVSLLGIVVALLISTQSIQLAITVFILTSVAATIIELSSGRWPDHLRYCPSCSEILFNMGTTQISEKQPCCPFCKKDIREY
jgi:hypothetical protein